MKVSPARGSPPSRGFFRHRERGPIRLDLKQRECGCEDCGPKQPTACDDEEQGRPWAPFALDLGLDSGGFTQTRCTALTHRLGRDPAQFQRSAVPNCHYDKPIRLRETYGALRVVTGLAIARIYRFRR